LKKTYFFNIYAKNFIKLLKIKLIVKKALSAVGVDRVGKSPLCSFFLGGGFAVIASKFYPLFIRKKLIA